MSNTATYRLSGSDSTGFLSHFTSPIWYVRDEDDMTEMQRLARIRSGDYLMTLSTEIERVAQSLADVKAPEAPELERIAAELLYLERNYQIVER